ncbi:beta-galactosidase [Plantactinospora siamensis]|uniref:beta-galactosidase n=1 Tax=Plantactinospora siamensis TaxID=555372 RepID=A0ABV6P4Z1_9ACTN
MTDWPRVGTAFYPEYLPADRLDTDLDLIAAGGFRVIRVGESVWSTWEPRDGEFDVEWLRPVLDGAARRGIDVIVGTPTYAIPAWLATAHPQVLAHDRTGRPIGYGGRQNADLCDPVYRRYAERVIRAVADSCAGHPAVVGWQVDNEPGAHLLHNDSAFAGFVRYVERRFGTVAAFNEACGLTFWSHRLTGFDELWRPDFNTNPTYDLLWRTYQDSLVDEFIGWQVAIVRRYARPDQFITTCIAAHQPAADGLGIAARCDRTAANVYHATQDGLAADPPTAKPQGTPWWNRDSGAWHVYLQADTARGYRDERFLVTETNAGSIGASEVNNPPYPGQWLLTALAMVARGADLVSYWHWHTLHFGAETFTGGILNHRLETGRCYAELSELAGVLGEAGPALAGSTPDAEVLLVTSHRSRRALEYQPPLVTPDNTAPDPQSYGRLVDSFYRAYHDVGAQLAVRDARTLPAEDPAALARRFPVAVVPTLYAGRNDEHAALLAYARAGGHLVLGPRTGYADELARARTTFPELIRAAGIDYDESSNLIEPLPVGPGAGGDLAGEPPPGLATGWADGLLPTGENVAVLARYAHPYFGRFAAATRVAVGAGWITVVGTVPDPELGRWLAARVLADAGVERPDLPDAVRRSTGRTPDGRRVHLYANWSWQPTRLRPADSGPPGGADGPPGGAGGPPGGAGGPPGGAGGPAGGPVGGGWSDLVTGEPVPAGEAVALGPWGYRLLIAGSSPAMTGGGPS